MTSARLQFAPDVLYRQFRELLQQLIGLGSREQAGAGQEDSEAETPELDLSLPQLELYFSRQIHKQLSYQRYSL